ncbi:hypothetical protein [Sinimarinibacterium flocculans]|uniref:hypothetical protein n=1 Tax=Sinimarinibacterium flocculans TaxID=985250 RepID=UPI00351996AC
MIRAKETRYAGYRFRSRLEARWAVFFEHLRLAWEYEAEGFKISEQHSYLPDFLLRDDGKFPDIWVEVKPQVAMKPKERKRYFEAAQKLTDSAENVGYLVVKGDPLEADAFLFGAFAGQKKLGPITSAEFAGFFALKCKCPVETIHAAAKAARSARFEFGESG